MKNLNITFSCLEDGKYTILFSFSNNEQLTAANVYFKGMLASNSARQTQLRAHAKYLIKIISLLPK